MHRQAFVHHPAVPPLVEELRAGGYAVAVLEERAELPRGQMVYPEPFRH